MKNKLLNAKLLKSVSQPEITSRLFELLGNDSFETYDEVISIMDGLEPKIREEVISLFAKIDMDIKQKNKIYKKLKIIDYLIWLDMGVFLIYGIMSKDLKKDMGFYMFLVLIVAILILLAFVRKCFHTKYISPIS